MTWPIIDAGSANIQDALGPLEPLEVLYEFDGPCIFTARTPAMGLVLVYLSEDLEGEALLRHIVATTAAKTIEQLKAGTISVRQALERGSLWMVDFNYRHDVQRGQAVELDDLPDDALPDKCTMLWPELEPGFRVRFSGPTIIAGHIPADVLAQVGKISSTALQPIFAWAARVARPDDIGRPPNWLRDLYALDTQSFAYGSLEVAFRTADLSDEPQNTLDLGPESPTLKDIQNTGWAALQKGLTWAVSDDDTEFGGDDAMKQAVLETLKRLAPNPTGAIETVEVSGRQVGRPTNAFVLSQEKGRRIRRAVTALKRNTDTLLQVFTGRIGALDVDKLTLILRDMAGEPPEIRLTLGDEQELDVANEAFYIGQHVRIAARSDDGKSWTTTDIEFVGTPKA